jgi:hypothetical protein
MNESPASGATGTTDASSGRGNGRGGGRNGRGRGRGNGRGRRNNDRTPASRLFKGNTEGMNGHVFQCYTECSDKKQFSKTVEALGEYVAKNMKYPGDMSPLTKSTTPKTPKLPRPKALTDEQKKDSVADAIWALELKAYIARRDYLEGNLKSAYVIIWGQCSEPMRAKLRSLDDHESKSESSDCVWLLKEIKAITYQFEGQRYVFLSIDDAHANFYKYKQGFDEPIADYLHNFQSRVEVLEHYGGSVGHDPTLLKSVDDPTSPKGTDTCKKLARNRALAIAFLKRADQRRFGTLWTDLENQYTRGNDQYPTDLTAAYSLLVNYKTSQVTNQGRYRPPHGNTEEAAATTQTELGMTFAQTTAPIAGLDGVLHAHITCFECSRKGHYATTCPSASTGAQVQLFQVMGVDNADATNPPVYDFTFTQNRAGIGLIPPTWILLDSQSTVSVFNNEHFLTNI